MKLYICKVILMLPIILNAQVKEEWVARYNSFGNSNDVIHDMVIDKIGNIYVTGYSSERYATIKYNSSGIQQWIAFYFDQLIINFATAIDVDDSGNVYVTGTSFSSDTKDDYVTIKYNLNGVQQWVARYNGPMSFLDNARDIKVDNDGNVYVTGYSYDLNYNIDYATIKYSSSGEELWVARYNGSGNSEDTPSTLVIDESGNVFVTGSSKGVGSNFDYLTIKYNSSGVEQWVARYDGPGSNIDYARDLILDDSGNIYVTGGSSGDYATVKYNSVGVQQWVSRYNGPINGEDEALAISKDMNGNIYVTGKSVGIGTSFDFATIKYNSNGEEQWVSRYNRSGDIALAIAVDNLSNIYVTGTSYNSSVSFDFTSVKYDSSGNEKWAISYNGPGNGEDKSNSIALDNIGNVYVAGYSSGVGTGFDCTIIKYSQSVGIEPIGSNIPDHYSLSQNYPNPFNPTTNINFSLPTTQYTILKVFDVTGREIATLVNENLQAGEYNYQFSIDDYQLGSGVYFYTLQSGEFISTKKMLLLK